MTPALADDYLFGSSGSSPWTLTINGTAYSSVDTGWIDADGYHETDNSNYFSGDESGYSRANNWGAFDLHNLAGPVTSAVLSLNTAGFAGGPVLTYTLFDTNGLLRDLDVERSAGDLGGIALYNDLGSGIAYGSRNYTSADDSAIRSITLNGAALGAIQSAAGGQFALGGLVSIGRTAVPEPATWGMMLLGFGMVGAFMRRKPQVTTALSYS
jgi:hypothetical protein